ncbi:MFS transporter [Actinoplanes aureus]|uniref:MFS transporter n=1 Tax=Actinoplanes aureus TaxID=2792083 RepID=A0A931CF89_9ACTN|nr:MFS transporter [Actinoplanes aureus]MBG0566138.1 MFS transporter [Actinoplanes aureus]
MAQRTGKLPLIVAAGAAFIASLDNLVVTIALPEIQRSLGTDLAGLTWTVNSYTVAFAVFMLAAAAVGDRIGRRRVFQAGVLLFTVASALVALSSSLALFAVFRAVQGLGAAMLVPLSLTLVVDATPAAKRAITVAVWSAAQGLAVAIGPFVGGLIVQAADWHWIFWLNVPVGLLIAAAAVVFPDTVVRGSGRFDGVGLTLLSGGLLGLVLGLLNGAEQGWLSGPTIWPVLAGAALLIAFGAWERRVPRPLLPARLLRERGFVLTNVNALLLTAGVFGSVFLLMQFLQNTLRYGPLEAGLKTLPWTLLPAVAAPVSGMLAERHGTRPVMVVGSGLQAAALVWFAVVVGSDVSYVALLPGMLLAGAGMGAFFAVVATQALAFAPREDEGLASGINNSVREIGVMLGVAVLATVFLSAGGSDTGDGFVTGLRPAVWVGSALLLLATVVAILTPPARVRDDQPAATGSG